MILTLRGALLAILAGTLLVAAPPTRSEALFGLFKKKEQVIEGGQTGPATVSSADAAAIISQYRTSRGLSAVTVDASLTAVAASQAQAMARARKMSHSLGGSFESRLSRGGYNALIAAENLAAGPRDLDEAMASWRASKGHNANLLKPGVTQIGIAVAYAPDNKYGNYWALELGAPDDGQTLKGPDGGPAVAAGAPVILERGTSYEALYRAFRWSIPQHFNIAVACVDRRAEAEPARPALIRYEDGRQNVVTYGNLRDDSDRLAHTLRARGIGRGDRIAVYLPQSAETVVAHLAAYKLGTVVVPLAALFGPDALRVRVAASGVRAAVTDSAGAGKLGALCDEAPSLGTIISVDGPEGSVEGWREALEPHKDRFDPVVTGPDDPALIIFTSGTTGPPKGALHGHRVLAGHLPGFAFTHDFAEGQDARFWTPSDWAWAGGLLNALLPSLYFGIPVVFGPFRRFDPDEAFALMARAKVTNTFLPPTAIKMMRAVDGPRERYDLRLRTVGAAGERLGGEAYQWGKDALGLAINEFYGQTECNYVLGASAALGVSKAGAIGKPIPGHDVALIDAEGRTLPHGEQGEIAVRRPDPAMFLGYFDQPQATEARFVGDWMRTGDKAILDDEAYVHFIGRDDDIITSAGYRIGPSEIEDCLAAHPAVLLAAAVGKPDLLRTEIVKAYVALRPGHAPSETLAGEIRNFVRERLSAAEYPREIEFVDEVPLTTSGKVIRRGFRERAAREAGAVDEGEM